MKLGKRGPLPLILSVISTIAMEQDAHIAAIDAL